MGELTIRNIDDAVLAELRKLADRRGLALEALAEDLLRWELKRAIANRAAGAMAIQAAQTHTSPLDSVDLIREDRQR